MLDYVRVRFDLAAAIGKNETEIALGANKRPFAKRIENHRGQGGRTVSGLGFEFADLVRRIGPLGDFNLAFVEIDIQPAQSAKFAGAQSAEGRDENEGPPSVRWRGL